MIERYSIGAEPSELTTRFGLEVADSYKPRYNAAPSQLLPVVTNVNRSGLSFFYWGLSPSLSRNKSISGKLINAHSDLLEEKPSYRKSLTTRRCLVPADGFYLWKSIGKRSRVPHRVVITGHSVFCMAGLWDEYRDDDNEVVHTFSIITTSPNQLVAPLNPVMPAILSPEQEGKWLESSTNHEELMALISPYSSSGMDCYTVSPLINSLQSDLPSLVNPVPAMDQYGNYTLFN